MWIYQLNIFYRNHLISSPLFEKKEDAQSFSERHYSKECNYSTRIDSVYLNKQEMLS